MGKIELVMDSKPIAVLLSYLGEEMESLVACDDKEVLDAIEKLDAAYRHAQPIE